MMRNEWLPMMVIQNLFAHCIHVSLEECWLRDVKWIYFVHTLRPARLLWRFISARGVACVSAASTKIRANSVPYVTSAEQPPHFQPSTDHVPSCLLWSHEHPFSIPLLQPCVIVYDIPADLIENVNPASLLPETKKASYGCQKLRRLLPRYNGIFSFDKNPLFRSN